MKKEIKLGKQSNEGFNAVKQQMNDHAEHN